MCLTLVNYMSETHEFYTTVSDHEPCIPNIELKFRNLKSTEEHTLSYFINFSLLHLVQGSEGTLNRGSVS